MATLPGLDESLLAQLRTVLARYPAVESAILYGSRAKGNFTARSDIDLALVGANLDRHTVARIALDLDASDIPLQVDTQSYQDISNPKLREHIDRVGIEIYAARSSTCPT